MNRRVSLMMGLLSFLGMLGCSDDSGGRVNPNACDESNKPAEDCVCDEKAGDWLCPNTCGEKPENKTGCVCNPGTGNWDDCQDIPKECGQMPEGKTGCECKDGNWEHCEDITTDCGEMPEGKTGCECKDGNWENCEDITTECGEMPEGKTGCECKDGTWEHCKDGCPAECPDNCDEKGVCKAPACGDGEQYDTTQGKCVCQLNYYFDENLNKCVEVCPCGQTNDADTGACVDIKEIADLSPYEKTQLALKETAMAYYLKGHNLQYETYMRGQYAPPEEATSQHLNYLVCSSFVYSVYYQALGIMLPSVTDYYHTYSKNNQDGNHPDIIFYDEINSEGKKDLSTKEAQEDYINNTLFKKWDIQAGDVLCVSNSTGGGHVVIVYDTNQENGKTSSHILHSTHHNGVIMASESITKLIHERRLHWDDDPNDASGIALNEGTVRYNEVVEKEAKYVTYNLGDQPLRTLKRITVLRPTIQATEQMNRGEELTYHHVNPLVDITSDGYVTSTKYDIQDSAKCRIQYSNIDIEKTVDIHAGSTVEPGGILTYSIKITNYGKESYKNLYITEELSEYVELTNSNGGTQYDRTVAWMIPEIEADKDNPYIIQYSVKVKEDPTIVGKTVKSTGRVAQITSAPIENVIAWSLTKDEVEKLKTAFNTLATDNKELFGKELIEKAYRDALGYELNLKDLQLGALYFDPERPKAFNRDKTQNDNQAKTNKTLFSQKCIPYYDRNNGVYDSAKNKALIYAHYYTNIVDSDAHLASRLNENHPLAGMILNHYYDGIFVQYQSLTEADSQMQYDYAYDEDLKLAFKYQHTIFENWFDNAESRTDRENIVYPDTLRDGDILIYANTLDKTIDPYTARDADGKLKPIIYTVDQKDWSTCQKQNGKYVCDTIWENGENGIYAYLFLDNKFIGWNVTNITTVTESNNVMTCTNEPDVKNRKKTELVVRNGTIPPSTDADNTRYGLKDVFTRFGELPKLYGKDFYVILRPSLTMKKSK